MSTDAIDAGLLILRMTIGIVFVAHGAKHVVNRDKTISWVSSIGFKAPRLQWFFMAFAEIGVGLSLGLGLLTTFGGAGVLSLLFVAFWTVHRRAGFWITARPDEGYEYVLLLVAVGAALAIIGPGGWSIDDAVGIADDLDGGFGAVAVLGGLVAAIGQLAIFWRPGSDA